MFLNILSVKSLITEIIKNNIVKSIKLIDFFKYYLKQFSIYLKYFLSLFILS